MKIFTNVFTIDFNYSDPLTIIKIQEKNIKIIYFRSFVYLSHKALDFTKFTNNLKCCYE